MRNSIFTDKEIGMNNTANLQERVEILYQEAGSIILGKKDRIREAFLALLADGHVLLEDVPGTGKTTLAKVFA